MTAARRGPTGAIAGLEEREATAILIKAVWKVYRLIGNVVSRKAMAEELRKDARVTADNVDAFLRALDKTPGISRFPRGDYYLPKDPHLWVTHRRWRFPAGTLDLQDALQLKRILARVEELTPTLQSLQKRLERAVGKALE